MGQTASEISYLLMDIIRPYVSKLSAYGLIQQRDCSTVWFSIPCSFSFRQLVLVVLMNIFTLSSSNKDYLP